MHYKSCKDNSGAIELARLPKIGPRSKHINVVFHRLREYIHNVPIHIKHVFMNYQCADAWTKPLPQKVFLNSYKTIFGFQIMTHISQDQLNEGL